MANTSPILCIFKCNWPITEILRFLRLYTHSCPQDIGPWRIKYDKTGKFQTDTTFILLTQRVLKRLENDYFVLPHTMTEIDRKVRMDLLCRINYPISIRVFDIRSNDFPKIKETNNLYIPLLDSFSDKQCLDILQQKMKALENFGLFTPDQWEIKIPSNYNNNRTRCAFINFSKSVTIEDSVICRHLFHQGSWNVHGSSRANVGSAGWSSNSSSNSDEYIRMSCFWAQTKDFNKEPWTTNTREYSTNIVDDYSFLSNNGTVEGYKYKRWSSINNNNSRSSTKLDWKNNYRERPQIKILPRGFINTSEINNSEINTTERYRTHHFKDEVNDRSAVLSSISDNFKFDKIEDDDYSASSSVLSKPIEIYSRSDFDFLDDELSDSDDDIVSDWSSLYSPEVYLIDDCSSESSNEVLVPFSITKSWSVPCMSSRCLTELPKHHTPSRKNIMDTSIK